MNVIEYNVTCNHHDCTSPARLKYGKSCQYLNLHEILMVIKRATKCYHPLNLVLHTFLKKHRTLFAELWAEMNDAGPHLLFHYFVIDLLAVLSDW